MTRKQRRLTMIGCALAVLAFAAGLVLYGLRDSIVFFSTPSMAASLFCSGHLNSDQPHAAACARRVISDRVVGDGAIIVRRARRHRRHDDAVLDLDRPNPRRRQKNVHNHLIPG